MNAVRSHGLGQRLGAELLGAFALTAVAAGCDVVYSLRSSATEDLARVTAPALLILAFVYTFGNVSGAHFNPAVTFAFCLRRVFPWRLLPAYVAAQVVGALVAAVLVESIFGSVRAGITNPHFAPSVAFSMETLLTFLLALVVLGTATRHRLLGPVAAIPVAATIALCGLFGRPVSEASMNPARSFGPAVVGGDTSGLWIYMIAPFVGAALAAAVTAMLHTRHHPEEREAAEGE